MDVRDRFNVLLERAGLCREGDAICRRNGTRTIKMSNFLVVPTADVEKSDGCSVRRFAEVVVYVYRGGEVIVTEAVTISMTELNNPEWVWQRWGLLCHIYPPLNTNKEYLRAAMFELAAELPKRYIYTNTGWCRVRDNYVFAYSGGSVGSKNISVELESGLCGYKLSERDFDLGTMGNAVGTLFDVAPPKIILPLIALAFLSPLNEFFRQADCEPAFVMYLLGKTQSRKSTLAALILSFFGEFTSSKLPMSFKDTGNALEKKCFILKDVLTVIDDFHPVFSAADKTAMMQKMQSIARGYGDRCGRSRLRSDMTIIKGNAPRGNVIVTGEDFPDIGESGSARTFLIEIDKKDIPVTEALNAAQSFAAAGVYSGIMKKYIEWLISKISKMPEQLKSLFGHFRAKALSEGIGVNGRTGDIVSWLQIGYLHFYDFAENELGCSEAIPTIQQAWKIFAELTVCQKEKSEELSPVKMFLNAVSENLQSGEIYVSNKNDKPLNKINLGAKCVGYFENGIYYFIPTKFLRRSCSTTKISVWRTRCQKLKFSNNLPPSKLLKLKLLTARRITRNRKGSGMLKRDFLPFTEIL